MRTSPAEHPSKIVLLCVATLAACAPPKDQAQSAASVGAFHQAASVCAQGGSLDGIDISYWQDLIDWPKVKQSGRAFAFVRAADGTYVDPRFQMNWASIKSVGMIRGAYQFF